MLTNLQILSGANSMIGRLHLAGCAHDFPQKVADYIEANVRELRVWRAMWDYITDDGTVDVGFKFDCTDPEALRMFINDVMTKIVP